jgi:hypothetical protein
MIPQIKHIAAYQVAPEQAIMYIAPVQQIVPSETAPGKYRLIFAEPAQKSGPVRLVPEGRVKALQNLRYTTKDRLVHAKTLDDVWGLPEVSSSDASTSPSI